MLLLHQALSSLWNFIQPKLAFNSITLILLLCLHFNYKAVTMFKLQNVQYLIVNNLSIILGRYIDELPQSDNEGCSNNCFTKTY